DTYPRLLINSFFSYIGYRNTIAVRDLIVDKLKDSEQFRIIAKQILFTEIFPGNKARWPIYKYTWLTLAPFLTHLYFIDNEWSVRINVGTPFSTKKIWTDNYEEFTIHELVEEL